MNAIETMQSLTYGTELEYNRITREKAAQAICGVVGGTIRHEGGSYDTWTVTAPDGRIWKAVSDASLDSRSTSSEVVTPILRWPDMETLQAVVRALRAAGAKATSNCSQHVHIGVNGWTPRQVANLCRIFYKQETLILKAAGTSPSRLRRYTRPTDREFIERLESMKPQTERDLNIAWYGHFNPNPAHYDSSRYRALNLNNLGTRHTVEFRFGEGTTHAGEVKTMIQLCLALAAKALTAKCATTKNPRVYDPESARYDIHVLTIRLGMIGDEFKTARHHMMKRMGGSAAWKHGRPTA